MYTGIRLIVALSLVISRLVAGAGFVLVLCESTTMATTMSHEADCTCALVDGALCPKHGSKSRHTAGHDTRTPAGDTTERRWCDASQHDVSASPISTFAGPTQQVFQVAPLDRPSSKLISHTPSPVLMALPVPLRPPRF